MPSVHKRKIFRLNEERLIAGLLPQPWILGLAVVVGAIFIINQPRDVFTFIRLAVIAAVITLAFVAVHRVSRVRIIPHWFKWQDAGIGGLIGRDLNPLPHRFQEMDDEETEWFKEQRRQDIERSNEYKRQLQALKKEEAMQNKRVVGRGSEA